MDIKAKIGEIVTKIQNDKDFAAKFQADPCKAIESVVGVDLPDDQVNAAVAAVKAQLASGDLMGKVSGILGGLKGE